MSNGRELSAVDTAAGGGPFSRKKHKNSEMVQAMPDSTNKNRDNVPGRYFVDEKCIGCTICSEIAPDNFRSNLHEGYDYVCKQPGSEKEEQLCEEVMDICPVNAIQNSGDG